MENRVYCLYRVSTAQQVDHNDKNQADIPMQRKACRDFADKMGWNIVREEQEEGISGHKVRAERRDKIQLIKDHAKQGKFDILLVFMFDRIGRIADETPFVVEWLAKQGIHVWSTQEGEQRFDSHADKLMNYIRFWQADGESEKTSIRTKTRLGQLVEEGHYKGGSPAYGYKLVKSGRYNKKKHELLDLVIDENEAPVVKMIFEKNVYEGYGSGRISTFLRQRGIMTRTGRPFHPASIYHILGNITYTGILRSGDSRSDVIKELQIIDEETFQRAQIIRAERSQKHAEECERSIPLNTRGMSLLSGNVFCGHCGSRLTITTNGNRRVRYVCYSKTRKQRDCNGQTGYTMHILDGMIDKIVHRIFERLKGISTDEILTARYNQLLSERKALYQKAKANLTKEMENLASLKNEVIKCIRGESSFSQSLLNELIQKSEIECDTLQAALNTAEQEYEKGQSAMQELQRQLNDLVSWSKLYDSASAAARKMVVSCLIRRVDVYRDYHLHITFNLAVEQWDLGIESDIQTLV